MHRPWREDGCTIWLKTGHRPATVAGCSSTERSVGWHWRQLPPVAPACAADQIHDQFLLLAAELMQTAPALDRPWRSAMGWLSSKAVLQLTPLLQGARSEGLTKGTRQALMRRGVAASLRLSPERFWIRWSWLLPASPRANQRHRQMSSATRRRHLSMGLAEELRLRRVAAITINAPINSHWSIVSPSRVQPHTAAKNTCT